MGSASIGSGTKNHHYVLFGSEADDQHPEFYGVYFEFDDPRDGELDRVRSVVVGNGVVEFELKDRRRIIVRRGMDELQWSTFLRGIHDVFGVEIVQNGQQRT